MTVTPIEVSSIREGPINVAVIDVTANQKGFEHKMTGELVQKLKDAGVPVLDGQAQFLDGLLDLVDAVPPKAAIVLLIAHGSETTPLHEKRVAHVRVGSDRETWQLLGVSGIDWSDKLVVLCVCWAFNRDMVNAVCESAVGALGIVASVDKLLSCEVLEFVPPFLDELCRKSTDSIDCEDVRSLVTQLEARGDYKMRFLAAGQTLEQVDPAIRKPRRTSGCVRLTSFVKKWVRRFTIEMKYWRCETLQAAIRTLQTQLREDKGSSTARERTLLRERLHVLNERWKRRCAPRGTVVRRRNRAK